MSVWVQATGQDIGCLMTLFLIMKGYDLMCTFYILVRYTSHVIMCTVGSICIIFDFTNKTFLLIDKESYGDTTIRLGAGTENKTLTMSHKLLTEMRYCSSRTSIILHEFEYDLYLSSH